MTARPDQPEPFIRGAAYPAAGEVPYPRANPTDTARLPADVWTAACVPVGVRLEVAVSYTHLLPTGVRTTSTITAFGMVPLWPMGPGCRKSGGVSDFLSRSLNTEPRMDTPMDLQDTPAQEAFRVEARAWLDAHVPPEGSLPSLDTAEGLSLIHI